MSELTNTITAVSLLFGLQAMIGEIYGDDLSDGFQKLQVLRSFSSPSLRIVAPWSGIYAVPPSAHSTFHEMGVVGSRACDFSTMLYVGLLEPEVTALVSRRFQSSLSVSVVSSSDSNLLSVRTAEGNMTK